MARGQGLTTSPKGGAAGSATLVEPGRAVPTAFDVLACPRCDGRLRLVALIEEAAETRCEHLLDFTVANEGAWIETDAFARAALVHAWRRRCDGLRWRGDPSSEDASGSSPEEEPILDPGRILLARQMGVALRAVLDALDLDARRVSREVREDFVMGMVQAFTAVALVLAGLPKLVGGVFHPYGCLWATERKDLPLVVVAAARGWKDPQALRLSHQHADAETVLRVVEGRN